MKKLLLFLFASAILVLENAQADPVRILPIGDSITEGNTETGDASYRTPLYHLLTEAGADFSFVGVNYTYDADLPEEQRRHCGKGGHSIGPDNNWLGNANGELVDYMSVDHDIILLMLGRNEYMGQTDPGRASIQYWNFINRIYSIKPDAVIYTIGVPPMKNAMTPDTENNDGATYGLNKDIPKIVNYFRGQGKDIYFVNIHPSVSGLAPEDYPDDDVHPGRSGSRKIAACISDAIKEHLLHLCGKGEKPAAPAIGEKFSISSSDIYPFYTDQSETPREVSSYTVNFREPWGNPLYEWELLDIRYTDWGDFKFDRYGTRYLKLRGDEYEADGIRYPGRLYNRNYYLQTELGIGVETGEFRIYLSYQKEGVTNNMFEKASFTALRIFPATGRICLSKRVDGIYQFQQQYEMKTAMLGNWKFQVYDEEKGVSVYATDQKNNKFCLFKEAKVYIPTGELMIEGLWADISPYTFKVVPVEEAEEKPETGILVESITMNHSDYELSYVDGVQLSATVMPENASDKRVKWYADDPEIAEVNSSGWVTGKSVGETTITAVTLNGGYEAKCIIKVVEVGRGDKPCFEFPTLSKNVLYQSNFGDENEGQLWDLYEHTIFEYGSMKSLSPGEREADDWSVLKQGFTGNYRLCFTMNTPSPHHYGEIRFCMADEKNYFQLKVMGGKQVEFYRIENGNSQQLSWSDQFADRQEYVYTVDVHGDSLEVSRALPEGLRENIWCTDTGGNFEGKFAFANGAWWDGTHLRNITVTEFAPWGVTSINENTKDLAFYPNPTTGELWFSDWEDIDRVEVYTLSGVMINSYHSFVRMIDLSALENGYYVLKVYKQGKVYPCRVIKR